jgi:DNA replication protein DnaC
MLKLAATSGEQRVVEAVLELEAHERRERSIARLRRAPKLPPGKTFDTLKEPRFPAALVRRLHALAEGDFVHEATNVLAFGLPGVGKSHAMCAVGHASIRQPGKSRSSERRDTPRTRGLRGLFILNSYNAMSPPGLRTRIII